MCTVQIADLEGEATEKQITQSTGEKISDNILKVTFKINIFCTDSCSMMLLEY
jgi:hypothetical protein